MPRGDGTGPFGTGPLGCGRGLGASTFWGRCFRFFRRPFGIGPGLGRGAGRGFRGRF